MGMRREKPQPIIDAAAIEHLEEVRDEIRLATRELRQARTRLEKTYEKIKALEASRSLARR